MPIVSQVAPTRVTLRVGEQLTVQSMDPQSAGIAYIYGPLGGSESTGSGAIAANGSTTFGPYSQVTKVLIAPTAGQLSYSIAFVGLNSGLTASTGAVSAGSQTVTGRVPVVSGYTTQAGFKKNGSVVAALGTVTPDAQGNVSYGPVTLVTDDAVSFPWQITADSPTSKVPSTGAPALSISGAPGSATVGDTTSFTPTISGGTAPYTVTATGLPPGRSITNSASGLTTGAYTTAGSYSATYTVTDSLGATASFTRSVTVAAAPLTATTTALSASNTTPASGTPITLTATVSPGAATGTVTFMDGSTSLGTGTLSGGTATLSGVTLASGSHSITAVYGGDSAYAGSTSSVVTVTVAAASGSARFDSTTATFDSTALTFDKAA